MVKMEVYTVEEIIKAVGLIETVQDVIVANEFPDELYDMLEEVVNILNQDVMVKK